MIRIGIVGVGFMGWIHWLGAKKLRGARVTAISSRDAKKRAGDWRSIRGNFGPPGEQVDLSKIKAYETVEQLLEDPDIDLVDICNPTDLHPETAIAALHAGKHVLVEKAIALTAQDADAMLAAAKKSGKLLMVAHVLPFVPEYAFAAEVVRTGKYGKLLAATFQRIISKPDWSQEIGDAGKTGGPAVDLHIHDTHFIGLLCGVPREVFSTGVVDRGTVVHVTTQYLYGKNGPSIACTSGALTSKARPFIHSFELFLEKATLIFTGTSPLRVLVANGRVYEPKLKGGGDPTAAFTAEIQTAVNGVVAGKAPDLLSAQLARDALVLCHKEIESVKTGKAVAV
ncbi:MAG: Gfo/Idh/MocA family oxidoreductase [Planctomycetia bacterium]|nr:Gfo/Idh/MocA family oxidoreductase [Planctomycetia bacterium]